jgi:hypothetical protein
MPIQRESWLKILIVVRELLLENLLEIILIIILSSILIWRFL